jgi:hypothetical protein
MLVLIEKDMVSLLESLPGNPFPVLKPLIGAACGGVREIPADSLYAAELPS